MADGLSQGDLATLSLLDPEQGVCPNGHPCTFDREPGYRRCQGCDYRGFALICWEITSADLEAARQAGADGSVMIWAKAFLDDRRN
jgi:hypothetical protein